jgi:hypothetical protein
VETALRSGRALTGFEPFGRDVERWSFSCTARGGYSLMVSVETQRCFDNAFVEFLTAPRSEKEALFMLVALERVCEALLERGVVGAFALGPVEDESLAAVFLANGFRRTGQLSQQLRLGARRADAILWSRKLAQPADT